MSIFLSAGHHYDERKADPGAISKDGKTREADLTIELRDLVAAELKAMGASFILDKDTETLQEYLGRIKPGTGSVVCEFHFNAGPQGVNGTECIVPDGAMKYSWDIGYEIAKACTDICRFSYRGVKEEHTTPRRKIAILRTSAGISVLPEICFISNDNDLKKYHENKPKLAKTIAAILFKYDALQG